MQTIPLSYKVQFVHIFNEKYEVQLFLLIMFFFHHLVLFNHMMQLYIFSVPKVFFSTSEMKGAIPSPLIKMQKISPFFFNQQYERNY